jgi:hypothetical protein
MSASGGRLREMPAGTRSGMAATVQAHDGIGTADRLAPHRFWATLAV